VSNLESQSYFNRKGYGELAKKMGEIKKLLYMKDTKVFIEGMLVIYDGPFWTKLNTNAK